LHFELASLILLLPFQRQDFTVNALSLLKANRKREIGRYIKRERSEREREMIRIICRLSHEVLEGPAFRAPMTNKRF
jgi:hypothetical protein